MGLQTPMSYENQFPKLITDPAKNAVNIFTVNFFQDSSFQNTLKKQWSNGMLAIW